MRSTAPLYVADNKLYKMKNILFLSTIILFLISCGGQDAGMPEDLEGQKKYLKEKKAELTALKTEIAAVEKEIEKLEPKKESKRLVSTQSVVKKDFNRFVELQGTIQSDDLVSATSEVPGRIIQMSIKEGDNIRKGQLIAKVDMEQLDKQKAELNKALELARDVYTRQARLWEQKIGSEIQYLQAKNNVERMEASLETLNFQQTKSNVYAPISGIAERVITKAGEMASPGMPIIQILNTSKVKVVADVPESYLAAVKRGDKVDINFPAISKDLNSRVSLVGKTIDSSNRTFKVEVNLNNGSGIYKPNLLALMKINDLTVKDAILAPLSIIQQNTAGETYVYIAEEGKAKQVIIETGESYDGEIIVTSGLDGSENVIVDGARFVNDGEMIEVKNSIENGTR